MQVERQCVVSSTRNAFTLPCSSVVLCASVVGQPLLYLVWKLVTNKHDEQHVSFFYPYRLG